jgi:hypothetical protein
VKHKIFILVVVCLLFLTGCGAKKIKTVSNIKLDKEQYIEQLVPVTINGTEDTIIITRSVKWEVPEHEDGETVSFSIAIPYAIYVDGIKYSGVYELNAADWSEEDNNPKYTFKVINLTKDGDISVYISLK